MAAVSESAVKMLGAAPNLTDSEARALVTRYQEGDPEALGQIMLSYARLAAKMANLFRPMVGLDHDDLLQEAVLMLKKAADSYNVEHDVPFFTWASLQLRLRMWKRLHKEREFVRRRRAASVDITMAMAGSTRADRVIDSENILTTYHVDPKQTACAYEILIDLGRGALKAGLVDETCFAVFECRALGMDNNEIRERLGIHRNATAKKMRRMLAAIEEVLDD